MQSNEIENMQCDDSEYKRGVRHTIRVAAVLCLASTDVFLKVLWGIAFVLTFDQVTRVTKRFDTWLQFAIEQIVNKYQYFVILSLIAFIWTENIPGIFLSIAVFLNYLFAKKYDRHYNERNTEMSYSEIWFVFISPYLIMFWFAILFVSLLR